MYNIGWFSTGRDVAACQLLQTVYQALRDSGLSARISFVFCNREPGESAASDKFLSLVAQLGIPAVCFSSAEFMPELRRENPDNWRDNYDRQVLQHIAQYQSDLVVLAGYMLIVSPGLCRALPMLNLHPASPSGPKGTWQEVIWQLMARRAGTTGVMIHLVTENLDEGPPVAYCSFPIQGPGFDPLWEEFDRQLRGSSLEEIIKQQGESQPLFAEIRRQGVIRELPLLTQTVLELAAGKLEIRGGQVFRHGRLCPQGCEISLSG